MNKADKIKALLADPSVESIGLQWSGGQITSHLPCSHSDVDLDIADYGEIEDYQVNFHQWPDLEKGDRVLCEIGEATIDEINWDNQGVYKVKFDDDSLDYTAYYRHELALLERGGDSD